MELTDILVADSGFACPRCAAILPLSTRDTLPRGRAYRCRCGYRIGSCFDARPTVRLSDSRFLDARVASGSTWFHWTAVEDWGARIVSDSGPETVHLGTLDTSMFMRFDRFRSGSETGSGWLYRVRLRREVEPFIVSDDTANDGVPGSPTRYVNVCETPGSVSIVARPGDVQVLDFREISAP